MRVYRMKEVCRRTGMSYETLKYYCNEGLVPGVKRDDNNRRVFSEHDVGWIESLSCLKSCGMGMAEMKEFLALCLEGPQSIPARQEILARKRAELLRQIEQMQASVDYIDYKQEYYADVLAGRRVYQSSLVPEGWEAEA